MVKGCCCAQVIDLDILDKVGSAKGVEELRVQLKQQVHSSACLVYSIFCQWLCDSCMPELATQ